MLNTLGVLVKLVVRPFPPGLDVEMYEAVRLLSILKETLPLDEKANSSSYS